MTDSTPILWWVRRDMRLADNPALRAAIDAGGPVIPVFVWDEVAERLGAAARWRMGLAVELFDESLKAIGSRLILRRGTALNCLRDLIDETGAAEVCWSRLVDPDSKARDEKVKAALKEDGRTPRSFGGHLLFEPWTVETKQGGYYKVFTAYWRAVRDREPGDTLPGVRKITAPKHWPRSDEVKDWALGSGMQRGREVVAGHVCVGEDTAQDRLERFIDERLADYARDRDRPGVAGTSNLSENLTYGEISPRSCWQAGQRALHDGVDGAETFLRELVWRDFAHHLIYHTPEITETNWKPDWDAFPWNEDERLAEVKAWKQGRTGIRFVDAAMREMYVTGTMHNRGRMIVGSYLTKNLLCHWRIGMDWFAEHLIDWDPASNAMGWQWVAGSGPDASPYFRIFNPETQLEKFDPDAVYANRWLAEGQENPPAEALSYFDAIPKRWNMSAKDRYPDPVVSLKAGREAALAAYEKRDF